MIAAMVLARGLNSTDFAAYSYFQLTASMVATYAALGLGVTSAKLFAAADTNPSVKPPLGTLWLLSFALSVVAGVITYALPRDWIAPDLEVSSIAFASAVVVLSSSIVPAGAVVGLEKYRYAFLSAVAFFVTLLALAIYASKVGSLEFAMFGFVVAASVQLCCHSLIVYRSVGFKVLVETASLRLDSMLRVVRAVGLMAFVSIVAASGSWFVGRIILYHSSNPKDFSIYAIGLQWYALALFLPAMISRVLLPRFVRVETGGSDAKQLLRIGMVGALAAGAVVAVIGSIFSSYIMMPYGVEYADFELVLVAFLFAALPAAPANTLGNAIIASNGERVWLAVVSLSFVVLVASAYFLVRYGPIGGAVAHAIASITLSLLAYWSAKKRSLL